MLFARGGGKASLWEGQDACSQHWGGPALFLMAPPYLVECPSTPASKVPLLLCHFLPQALQGFPLPK